MQKVKDYSLWQIKINGSDHMKFSLKSKLIISFTVIILITGLITASVGSYFYNEGIIKQVQDRVRNDLNTAREIWNNRLEHIKNNIYYATFSNELKNAIANKDRKNLLKYLTKIKENGDFEILSLTDSYGRVILRSSNPHIYGDTQINNQLVGRVLSLRHLAASPVIIPVKELEREGKEFAARAMDIYAAPGGSINKKDEYSKSAMMLKAAAPVWGHDGRLLGVLYGGDLLNKNHDLVDKIKNTLYRFEKYKGMDTGSVTIFQNDVRISTNVLTERDERAVGTTVSKEVYEHVCIEGRQWIDRAFVIDSWYITAYEPIIDIDKNMIGMLGVGVLEEKYTDIRNRTLLFLFGITLSGMFIALIVSTILANSIIRPIKYLVRISQQISGGDFQVKVDVKAKDELGELERAYKNMASALKDRDEKLKKAMDKLEELSRTDSLTGILNRRAFTELAQIEIDRARRYNHPISVAYIDLDNFKTVNDEMGHNTGDELLCSLTKIVKNNIREIDLFARLGGDEFILLLTKTDSKPGYDVLQKLKQMLLAEMEKNGWPVTFSIGLVTFYKPPEDIEEMIKKSDDLMYRAKRSGKNRVEQIEVK